jgi:import inner membrane translocase subunit TIM23
MLPTPIANTTTMLARSALCPARAFARRYPPSILAPCSTAAASFSTCARPAKLLQQSQTPFFTQQRAALLKPAARNASTAPSTSGAKTTPGTAALTWNDFFALRRTRRRIGQACSGASAIGVTYYGLTFMINNGYDAVLSEQLGGFDPMMLMGLSTLGMLAAGWLIGPIFGNQVFNLAYRGVLREFTAVCRL